jgi:amino acid transporter
VAAQWAWLSFVLAGAIALASAYSYSRLAVLYGESGGAFTFLREIHQEGFAGGLSWVLIAGYVLTISVYAFTFGEYVAHLYPLGPWLPRVCAVAVIAVLTVVNLRGVGDSSALEVITVWGKLVVLVALAGFGLVLWKPSQLTSGVEPAGWTAAFFGAAMVFMAYEGFQLLTYDYDDIEDARHTLPRAALSAVVVVIAVYVVVALGATMLVGAGKLVEEAEVALAAAGQQAAGLPGLILISVAAAFSTASAINATLFATARLMEDVSERGELPPPLTHENRQGVPDHAVLGIAAAGAVLAVVGSLSTLVEVASLTFLFTFGTVNVLAFRQRVPRRWICLVGAAGALAAVGASAWRLARHSPWLLACFAALLLLAAVGRPWLLKRWS